MATVDTHALPESKFVTVTVTFTLCCSKQNTNRRPQKPAVTQESEIPTLLNMTGSLQDSKMTTSDDKKSLIWLSKQVHPKLFEMHKVADTLTQSTDRIPQGPTAGTQVKYVPGRLKWL